MSTFSKAVVLTVITLQESLLLHVAMAFPAYIGLLNVSSSIISIISGIIITSRRAASLGAIFLPLAVFENKI